MGRDGDDREFDQSGREAEGQPGGEAEFGRALQQFRGLLDAESMDAMQPLGRARCTPRW